MGFRFSHDVGQEMNFYQNALDSTLSYLCSKLPLCKENLIVTLTDLESRVKRKTRLNATVQLKRTKNGALNVTVNSHQPSGKLVAADVVGFITLSYHV